MEHNYVGDLIPSINSYQKIIDQYERGLKKENFMRSKLEKTHLASFIQTGNILKTSVCNRVLSKKNIKVVKFNLFYVARCKGTYKEN